jgi:hypothetical protein
LFYYHIGLYKNLFFYTIPTNSLPTSTTFSKISSVQPLADRGSVEETAFFSSNQIAYIEYQPPNAEALPAGMERSGIPVRLQGILCLR